MERFPQNTHSITVGYVLWIFGFTGSHRFYYGRPLTGTLWFLTGGFFLIGWLIDFFLIPGMDLEADLKYTDGPVNYSIAWVLLTFLGVWGLHRIYIGRVLSGLLYMFTVGLFGFGLLYDFWNFNEIISQRQTELRSS